MVDVNTHGPRLDRVESEVHAIRGEMGSLTSEVSGLKADVKGLGAILGRIEKGILRAQERDDRHEERSRPNVVAIVSVLITIISIIVGGAWIISGQLSEQYERSEWIMRQIERTEARLWQMRGGDDREAPQK